MYATKRVQIEKLAKRYLILKKKKHFYSLVFEPYSFDLIIYLLVYRIYIFVLFLSKDKTNK